MYGQCRDSTRIRSLQAANSFQVGITYQSSLSSRRGFSQVDERSID